MRQNKEMTSQWLKALLSGNISEEKRLAKDLDRQHSKTSKELGFNILSYNYNPSEEDVDE